MTSHQSKLVAGAFHQKKRELLDLIENRPAAAGDAPEFNHELLTRAMIMSDLADAWRLIRIAFEGDDSK